MAQIVLIQPNTGSWDEMSRRPPDSLLAIAALPHAKGYDVRIIDQRVSRDFLGDLDRAVGPETVIIGLTAITGSQIRHAIEASRVVKERYPRIPVCWGGVHATLVPEQTIAHSLIDYVVVGDGDYVFCELFERLRDGRPIGDLRGLLYKTPGQEIHSNVGQLERIEAKKGGGVQFVRRGGAADVITDLDALPDLPLDLINPRDYNVFDLDDGRFSFTMQTARGCPFRCKFCSDPVIHEGRWRGWSAKRVLEKVDHLYNEHGVRAIFFQDDYFPGPKKRLLEILEGLTKYRRDLIWATSGMRADVLAKLNDDEWQLLHDSGCFSLEVGIESGNPRIIKFINKGETLDEMRLANQKMAHFDFIAKYTLIVGFPGETHEEMMDTVRFARELQDTNPHAYTLIFPFSPVVGTAFYEEMERRGFKTPQTLEEWQHLDYEEWMEFYGEIVSPEQRNLIEAISFSSYFSSPNVAYKFSNSALLRLAFHVYHPIAKWRFRNEKFGFYWEKYLRDGLMAVKSALSRRPSA